MSDADRKAQEAAEKAEEERLAKKRAVSSVVMSVLVHVLLLVGAASLTIMIIAPKQKMMFEGKKSPTLPAKKLEHAIRVKQMKKQTRKPQIMQRLVTEAPSKVSLPEMPQMKTPNVKDMRDTPLVNSRAGSIGGLGGGGGGAGRGLTGGMGWSDTKFFGENLRTRAINICLDISPSMVAKGVVQDTVAEAEKMLSGMGVSTKFNVIVYVDGALPFAPQMVYATQENKTKVIEWLKHPFDSKRDGNRPGFSGSTPSEAIRMAIEQGADTVFVLTDDPPYLSQTYGGPPIETHQKDIVDYVKGTPARTGKTVKLYPVLYKPHQNARGKESYEFYKGLARDTGGKCKIWPPEWKSGMNLK